MTVQKTLKQKKNSKFKDVIGLHLGPEHTVTQPSRFHLSHSLHAKTKVGVNVGLTAGRCHYVWWLNWKNVTMTMIYHKLIPSDDHQASFLSSVLICWYSSIKLKCMKTLLPVLIFLQVSSFPPDLLSASLHISLRCSRLYILIFLLYAPKFPLFLHKMFPVDHCYN